MPDPAVSPGTWPQDALVTKWSLESARTGLAVCRQGLCAVQEPCPGPAAAQEAGGPPPPHLANQRRGRGVGCALGGEGASHQAPAASA